LDLKVCIGKQIIYYNKTE